jgi:ATP-dependent DNA ligase
MVKLQSRLPKCIQPACCSVPFIAPCLPTKTDKLPSGSEWLNEIKHDWFRVIARKKGRTGEALQPPWNDLTYRFPLIVETLEP